MDFQSSRPKILFIAEGAVAEERFLRQFENYVPLGISEEIITYKTNIYQLYNRLFNDGEAVDLMRVLISREMDPTKKDLLRQPFAEIYLVFDYDLHDSQYTDKKIRRLMAYFDNSTENGLLLLNYPMLESYRHLRCIPDGEYRYRKVPLFDVPHYKAIVRREGAFDYIPNEGVMLEIIRHNIDKLNYINHRTVDNYILKDNIEEELIMLLENEIELKNRRKLINIMNTGALFGFAYAPKRMTSRLKEYLDKTYSEG